MGSDWPLPRSVHTTSAGGVAGVRLVERVAHGEGVRGGLGGGGEVGVHCLTDEAAGWQQNGVFDVARGHTPLLPQVPLA